MSREKSAGGRPPAEVWAHVEKLAEGNWKCKYCGRVSKGSASRIRNHLSGKGNDISACASVSKEFQEEILRQKAPKKRQLEKDKDVRDHSPSSSSNEEHVTSAFLKFLMCNKFSSVDSDVLKDPNFREFLERAHQFGFPPSLLRGDSKLFIEKSLLNIKEEVHQYMLLVTESWKTTGCTWMMFNLHYVRKGMIISTLERDMYVVAMYCPKGIIFVETPHPWEFYSDYKEAFKRHSPSLYIDDAVSYVMYHISEHQGSGEDQLCELTDEMTIGWTNLSLIEHGSDGPQCIRHKVLGICIDICRRSVWAQNLIDTAVWIHELLLCDYTIVDWYYEHLKKKGSRHKGFVNKNVTGTHASRLSIFLSIFMLKDEVKEKLLYTLRFGPSFMRDPQVDHRLETILNDSKFWRNGRTLEQILTKTLEIPDMMETLVPTAGYLAMAIDIVKRKYVTDFGPYTDKDELMFLQELESKLSGIIEDSWTAASYLNPVYFLKQDVQKHPEILEDLKLESSISFVHEEDEKEFDKEVQRYGDVFRNLQTVGIELQNYHPVKLWEKYGDDLPLLRKCAIIAMSQPVSCICNQVKKHVYELKGADDCILRLNVRMMEEFKSLGDDIYKPIDEIQRPWSYIHR